MEHPGLSTVDRASGAVTGGRGHRQGRRVLLCVHSVFGDGFGVQGRAWQAWATTQHARCVPVALGRFELRAVVSPGPSTCKAWNAYRPALYGKGSRTLSAANLGTEET